MLYINDRNKFQTKGISMKAKFKYNSDPSHIQLIINGLIKKKEKYGEYYCPCKVQNIKANICPCEEYKLTSKCHCKLYEE